MAIGWNIGIVSPPNREKLAVHLLHENNIVCELYTDASGSVCIEMYEPEDGFYNFVLEELLEKIEECRVKLQTLDSK